MECAHVPRMEEQSTAINRQGFQPGTSGNPRGASVISVRTDELFASMAADFTSLSATDEIMLRANCRLLARAEKTRDVDAAVRLNSEARRGIDALRRRITPKHDSEPRLEDILCEAALEDAAPPRRPHQRPPPVAVLMALRA